MAVTFHNFTQTAGGASVGSRTVIHTVSAAGCAVLVFTYTNASTSISSVGANVNGFSYPFTNLGSVNASAGRAEVWGLSSCPQSATLSISINTVAVSLMFATVVVSYTGQRQIGGSPFGTVVSGSANASANPSFSVSSTTTDIVVYGFGVSGAPAVTITTGNNRGSATLSTSGRLVVGDVTGAATISISATAATSNTWAFLGVPIVASAAAPTTSLAFDNAGGNITAVNVSSLGFLLTATANTVLLVWASMDQNTNVSAINVNTLQLGFLGGVSAAAPLRLELWGLTSPPTGILTISAVLAGGATLPLGLAGVTYVGAKNSTGNNPFGNVAVTSGSATIAYLSVSSTAGNFVVAGFGSRMFNPVSTSAIPGMNSRFTATAYPSIHIADTIGGPAITVGAVLAAATAHLIVAVNLIQSGASTNITGSLSATDVTDKFSASGYVIVSGRLSATDVTDKFSASGYAVVTGRLSATGAADRLSATGYVVVSGRLSATGVADIFSASGYTLGSGRMSATDAQDRFSASGYVIVSGRMSATDAADIFSASGNVINTANVNGRLSATDATDRFSASGYVIVSGLATFTDRPDILSASGAVIAVSTPAALVTPDTSSLGGKKEKKTEYFRADDAFWEAREKYLRALQPALSAEPELSAITVLTVPSTAPSPVDPSLLIAYRATRTKLVNSIPAASSMRQLKAQGKRLYEVNAKIAEAKRQDQIRAAATLVRLQREERQAKRAADIRRLKRRVILLAATRAAVALTYLIDKL